MAPALLCPCHTNRAGCEALSWRRRGRSDILPPRAPLPQRAQEFQQCVEALFGLIHVDLVSRPFDHREARPRNGVPYLYQKGLALELLV